jgi:hypothetical protein
MPALLAQDLIFIDETGVDLALTRLRGRSPRGKRARGKRPSKRGKRVSIISAINLKEVMAHCQLRGTTDGLAFEAFIAQRLVPKLWKGACVIMDNCSIHKGEEIKALSCCRRSNLNLPPSLFPGLLTDRKLFFKN